MTEQHERAIEAAVNTGLDCAAGDGITPSAMSVLAREIIGAFESALWSSDMDAAPDNKDLLLVDKDQGDVLHGRFDPKEPIPLGRDGWRAWRVMPAAPKEDG